MIQQQWLTASILDDIGDFFKGEPIFKMACDLFNSVIGLIYSLLGVNPTAGSYEKVWNIVQNLYTVFSAVGAPLVVIFFVYGYCRDAVDIKAELQLEATVKMFIRMIMAVTLMEGVIHWLPRLFGWAMKLLGVTEASTFSLNSKAISKSLTDSQVVLVGFIMAVIFLLIVLAASVIMIWTCLGRFLNLYLITPFGSIALSTIAAGGQAAQTGYAYIKSMLLYTFEIVPMGIVLAITPAFLQGSSITDSGSDGFLVLVEAIVKILVIASGLKGAETVIKKATNL